MTACVGFRLEVNGQVRDIEAAPDATLLPVLRDDLGLRGAKQACGRGECGACTVLVDGRPVLACLTLVSRVRGAVTTVEGLAEANTDLREAFADCGAFQCGYCTPGQVVTAAALLQHQLPAARAERERLIREQMSGNICRCTGYTAIVDAVMRTAEVRELAARSAA
jgi:aerobic-type carbon monoxide dehydrogenase small subunit (CoxS/CutS family)